jgi:hypothetical protein
MKEDMSLHLPLPCLLPSEINLPVGNKQKRNKQGVVKEARSTWRYGAASYNGLRLEQKVTVVLLGFPSSLASW